AYVHRRIADFHTQSHAARPCYGLQILTPAGQPVDPPPDAVASVRAVEKVFGSGAAAVRALNGVDLDVRRSEALLLTDPSGSGKTTLLSIMGCILRPSGGRLRICGRETRDLSRKDLAALRLR